MKQLMSAVVNLIRTKFPQSEKFYYFYRDLRYRLFNKGKPVKCKTAGFSLSFELDSMDNGLSRELATEKIHEPLTTRVLADVIKPGWVVVDVGSHLGYFAILEACLVGPAGKVIAIEPSPTSYDLLVKNIERNGLTSRIATYNVAVSNKREKRAFYIGSLSNQSGFYPLPQPKSIIEVDTYPLDDIIVGEPKIDAIRMDIEGAEYEVIHGITENLKQYHPMLLIELHPSLQRKTFLKMLSELGYKCLYVIDRRKNTSFLGGVMALPKDVEQRQISDLLQMKESENVYLVVLKY